MAQFNTDFLQVKSGPIVNFIRFSSIQFIEADRNNMTISLTVQDLKENFVIKCRTEEIFQAYVDILNKVLKLDFKGF